MSVCIGAAVSVRYVAFVSIGTVSPAKSVMFESTDTGVLVKCAVFVSIVTFAPVTFVVLV